MYSLSSTTFLILHTPYTLSSSSIPTTMLILFYFILSHSFVSQLPFGKQVVQNVESTNYFFTLI
jgi:hypothetical protein